MTDTFLICMSTRKSLFFRQIFLGFILVVISTILVSCAQEVELKLPERDVLPFPEAILSETISSEREVLFEDPGKIIVVYGSACGESDKPGEEEVIKLEESMDIPDYANNATIFLNGWYLKYLNKDHAVGRVATMIDNIQIEDSTLKWNAAGVLKDKNFDDGYEWCYYYTIIAWNGLQIDAVVDHDDLFAENWFWSPIHEGKTALLSLPSYIQNPAFAAKKTVAVLPRGFHYGWEEGFSQKDHHLLQIAYNLDHSEKFVEHGKDYGFAPAPPLPTSASLVGSGFVSWETYAIFKDNRLRRDYRIEELVSALGGNDVGTVQPPFTILPREDLGLFEGCISSTGGVRTEDIIIENIPFKYAVPMLTGWELWHGCDDEHVTEIGIWLSDIEYDKNPDEPVGTLRYKVSSVLRDKDSKPRGNSRHKVSILGLNSTGLKSDLMPFSAQGGNIFCTKDSEGRLIIFVANVGGADAPFSTTTVEFFPGGSFELPTPAIPTGSSRDLLPLDIPKECFDPNCDFRITVDAKSEVIEVSELNNSVDSICQPVTKE